MIFFKLIKKIGKQKNAKRILPKFRFFPNFSVFGEFQMSLNIATKFSKSEKNAQVIASYDRN